MNSTISSHSFPAFWQTSAALHALCTALPDALLVIDQDQIIQVANTACCDLLGYNEPELVDHAIGKVLVMSETTKRLIAQCLSPHPKKNEPRELQLLSHDGQQIKVDVTLRPAHDATDQPMGVVMVMRPHTLRGNNARLLEQIMDISTDTITVVDRAGNYRLVNQVATDCMGLDKTDLADYHHVLARDYPDLVAAQVAMNQAVLDHDRPLVTEEQIATPDGELVWIRIVKRPFVTGEGERLVLTATTDITEQKRAADMAHLLSHLLDLSPDLISVRDESGNFLLANQRMADELVSNQ